MAVSVARDNRIFLQFPYSTIELTTYKHRNGRFHLFGEHLVENWHPIVHLEALKPLTAIVARVWKRNL
jgi:hypothetical protein